MDSDKKLNGVKIVKSKFSGIYIHFVAALHKDSITSHRLFNATLQKKLAASNFIEETRLCV